MLPVLAYYFYYGRTNAVLSAEHKRQLEYWFWRVAYSERYSGSNQTRMSEDAGWIRKLIEENTPYDGTITAGIDTLVQSSMRSSSALRNGFLCLLNLQNPLHFINGSRLDLRIENYSSVNSLEKHHIFPVAFLERIGHRKQHVHLLPNFCFLPMELNRWISDRAPSDYMSEIQQELGQQQFERIMMSHLIPVGENSGIWNDNYERFLRQRAELLLDKVRRVAGISDVVAEEHRNPVIDTVEMALRTLIHDHLMIAFGLDYWRKCVPKDVNDKVEQRIEREVRNKPGMRKAQFDDSRSKLDFCDISDYPKIILRNWQQFSSVFKSKRDFETTLLDLNEFRNAVKHNRPIDNLLEIRARAALVWLSRTLDLDLSAFDIVVES